MSEEERFEIIEWLKTERKLCLGRPDKVTDETLIECLWQEICELTEELDRIRSIGLDQ